MIIQRLINKSQQYQCNPRSISETELNRLEGHVLKFGDLSGSFIVAQYKANLTYTIDATKTIAETPKSTVYL